MKEYILKAKERITDAFTGDIKRRPMNRPIYQPDLSTAVARAPEK
jgi:hypothetical protein